MDADLEGNPQLALNPTISYRIASLANRAGWFTGKSLGDFINDAVCDYRNARRIINALDQAEKIRSDAEKLEAALNVGKLANCLSFYITQFK